LAPWNIGAQTPDEFLIHQFHLNSPVVLAKRAEQAVARGGMGRLLGCCGRTLYWCPACQAKPAANPADSYRYNGQNHVANRPRVRGYCFSIFPESAFILMSSFDLSDTTRDDAPGFRRIDWIALKLIAVWGALAAAALLVMPKFFLPAEDAAILFQYSRNLAHHGLISYNAAGPRAEGATDFAWMALLSLGMKLGLDPFWLIALINCACLVMLAVLVLKIAGQPLRSLALLFIMGAFALMPQIFAAASGFSVLPFECLLALLAWSFLNENDVAAPLVGLVLCLFRPDGVVFAVPLLLAALLVYPRRGRRLLLDVLLFVLPGFLYFLWRWHYFGEFLPLPFLVKSNAERVAHILVLSSLHGGAVSTLFVAVLLALALRGRLRQTRNLTLLLCLIVLPDLFYFSMRLDQNIGHRFFGYLPAAAALLPAANWES